MIRFSKKMYVTEEIENKLTRVKWKLKTGAGLVNTYVITLSESESDLFNIYSAWMFKQRVFRKCNHYVVGIAHNEKSAMELVQRMVMECFEEDGTIPQGGVRQAVIKKWMLN